MKRRLYVKNITIVNLAPYLKEFINGKKALETMTINPTYQFSQEDYLGSLNIGKVANMVVYDTDFLNNDIEKKYLMQN